MNDKKVKEAEAFLKNGELEKALEIYFEILKEVPDHPEISHIVGIIFAKKGDFKKALNYIDKALKLKPDEAAFYNSKGNIYSIQNNIKEALRAYQKAIQIDPKYAYAHNNIGKCLYLQKKLSEAEKAYKTALSLLPNYTDAHYNLGILFANLGKNKAAEKELKKVIALNENYVPAYGQLAEVYLNMGNPKKAIDNYLNRLQFQPDHIDSWHGLAQALIQENEIEKAIEAFEKVLILDDNYPEINHSLANAYLKSGDPDKALNYYFRQISKMPMMESYFNMGVIFMNKNRNKDAIQYFEQAAKSNPDYLPIYVNLGAIYLKLNNVDMAIKNYKKALELKPNDVEIKHILSAISEEKTPEAAPKEYLEHLFNQYSSFYDQHLTKHLQYKVPEALYNMIEEETEIEAPIWKILDLGCGTGLCGEYFKKIAKELIGIDVSSKMIEVAKEKNIYDNLIVGDIQTHIDKYKEFDLIIAADVFTYIGELSILFHKIHETLKPGGFFAFSVEKTETEPYELQKTIRYAHSKKYLKSLIEKNNFIEHRFDNLVLRKQYQRPIEGFLVLLQRKNQSD